jgi:toxin ParE1/3/4
MDFLLNHEYLFIQCPNMGKAYHQLAPNLRGAPVEDYLIFYYPRPDGIDIARIVSGYRDLDQLF